MKRLIVVALAGLSLSAAAEEHIVNGTFNDSPVLSTSSQTGWNIDSNNYHFKNNSYGEGSIFAPGVLSQQVLGVTGALTLSFDYASPGGGYEYVSWNNDILGFYLGAKSLATYTFNVTGTGNDTLSFVGANLPSYNQISNVSLISAVPEPGTYAMLLAGVGLVGAIARRRRGAAA